MVGHSSKIFVQDGSNKTYIKHPKGNLGCFIMGFSSERKGDDFMKIVHVMDHYEVYDHNGNFICSGDTLNEAVREAELCLAERR